MVNKIKIMISIIVLLIILFCTNRVNANYQSNNGTKAYVNGDQMLVNIRNMEASGQVMGLAETVNSSTLKATSTNNNIDVHMMKNTEWGTIAMLSASQDYGKKGEGTARYVIGGSGLTTTTGNISGIYVTGSSFCTAGVGKSVVGSKDSNYYNLYEAGASYNCDARIAWHNASIGWRDERATYSYGVTRRSGNSIFSFSYNSTYWSNTINGPAYAAVTNGEGV